MKKSVFACSLFLCAAISAVTAFQTASFFEKREAAQREALLEAENVRLAEELAALEAEKAELEKKNAQLTAALTDAEVRLADFADGVVFDSFDWERLNEVEELIATEFLWDAPDREALTNALLDAYIAALGDSYAAYYDAEEYAAYLTQRSGSFVGIGIRITNDEDGAVLIDAVYKDSPAEGGGLLAGDRIVAVDGYTLSDGFDALSGALTGEEGTAVSLTVERGGERLTLTLVRAKVTLPTVSYTLAGEVGTVVISGFDGGTFGQFKEAVDFLTESGATSLIFDLRGNPGGQVSAVCRMLCYLLPTGSDLTRISFADGEDDYTIRDGGDCRQYVYAADGRVKTVETFSDGAHQVDLPFTVLVDEKTASAAELFAAALRDNCGSEIVGTVTRGKGCVQKIYELSAGCGVKFTISLYSPPVSENFHGVGIVPDRFAEGAAE